MAKIIKIEGGRSLRGEISVSGAKNAALSLMIASLLTDQNFRLENVPTLTDIEILKKVLESLGAEVEGEEGCLRLCAHDVRSTTAPYALISQMRAAFWVIGPLLARWGRVSVSLPGGDPIGVRPVDIYLEGLKKMGAEIELEGGYIEGRARKGLRGAEIAMPLASVGATQTLMMAAALAKGETRLKNAAREPEVVALGEALLKMGAKIEGLGTGSLMIEGRSESLEGAALSVPPDRIEAGTYAMAAAMTRGEILLKGAPTEHMGKPLEILRGMGVLWEEKEAGLLVKGDGAALRPVRASTAPYPGFPTDLQAQLMALATTIAGVSEIAETVFENRFLHVGELTRFGARIRVSGNKARIEGVKTLRGADVMATDLRASASLILCALAAKGASRIHRVYHLDRGFEKIEKKLASCGAKIWREDER